MKGFDKGFFGELEKTAGSAGPGGFKSFVEGFKRPAVVDHVGKRLSINAADKSLNPFKAAISTKRQLIDGMRGIAPGALDRTKQWHGTAKWGARARKALPYAATAGALYAGHRLLRRDDDERRRR